MDNVKSDILLCYNEDICIMTMKGFGYLVVFPQTIPKRFVTVVGSLHECYVGHCASSEVYLIYTTFWDLRQVGV